MGSGGVSVVDTTEIRYLLDARTDVGVKFRNGEILELKTRLETGPPVELTGGFAGVLERWRKWTLADRVVQQSAPQRWIHGDKWIVKRRFSLDGAPTIQQVGLDRGESMGYPEWLGRRCR
jgi:hypothetical protein